MPSSSKALLVVVQPPTAVREVSVALLERAWREVVSANAAAAAAGDPVEALPSQVCEQTNKRVHLGQHLRFVYKVASVNAA